MNDHVKWLDKVYAQMKWSLRISYLSTPAPYNAGLMETRKALRSIRLIVRRMRKDKEDQ